ncbi:MAG: hypothetical protein Q9226_001284 [Calogaya cf. arnoldii]
MPLPAGKEDPLITVREVPEPEYPLGTNKQMIIETYALGGATRSVSTAGSSTSSSTPTTATSTESHQWDDACESFEQPAIRRCPVLEEFHQAETRHPILASTGCTRNFCQAGRAVHTDEPRVGENRDLEVVEQEAAGFLRELHQEGFFDSDKAFESRLDGVLAEIRTASKDGVVRESQKRKAVGGSWHQTPAELEFGIRRAWRNARKCIMRSHSGELK